MKVHKDREMWPGADGGFLDSIEHAIAEKMQAGYADEARYGFVAQLANATPPVNETFQRMLRARILTELTKNTKEDKQPMTIKDRLYTINFRRLSLVGALATIVILALAIAAFPRLHVWQPEMEDSASQIDSGDIDALADRLNEEPTSRTVLVFPGEYSQTLEMALAERIQHQIVSLTLDDASAMPPIHAALGALLPSSGLVDVVLVDQGATDTAHQVRATLEQQLYRLYRPGEAGTEAFGALERNRYAVGPEGVTLEPVGAVFENGVELVAGGVLDDPQPGEPLRLAFDWRVMGPVDDSVVVFAHLICDGSQLVAQRDAVPGNGLFPVESWEPGELVRDQFALLLPPDLPAGEYEIQVGIYNDTSGQRYRVTAPEEGAYYVVVKRYAPKDAGSPTTVTLSASDASLIPATTPTPTSKGYTSAAAPWSDGGTPSAELTTTIDISDWQIYEDDEREFQLRYPDRWRAEVIMCFHRGALIGG